ncbi:hypothetical protein BB934_01825 [Microvirga ossetica]|uniref:Uncharacterized protein n=1 Tax=Microvirga ossetica TaxID=1882682 RepID=A0A1B2EAX5_9HYPH|nr:hypothetical protein [Microvirga ossetica]ANY77111.1 hypothetical protein BB934_01825 [Microvirga ossetica]
MTDTETLTKEDALAFTKVWIDNRLEPTKDRWAFSEANWLMQQLAARCIAETLREGGDEVMLQDRLAFVYDLLRSVRLNAQRKDVKNLTCKNREDLDETQQRIVENARHEIWRRHDPKRAFNEGLKSEHMPSIHKQVIWTRFAEYLDKPWLRHPVLDWVFVDMLVSAEIALYGEHIKQFVMPFPRDAIGMNSDYLRSQGNLEKMRELNRTAILGRALWNVVCTWILPPVAIGAAFYFGWSTTGMMLLGLYLLIIAIGLGAEAGTGVKKLLGKEVPQSPSDAAMSIML